MRNEKNKPILGNAEDKKKSNDNDKKNVNGGGVNTRISRRVFNFHAQNSKQEN